LHAIGARRLLLRLVVGIDLTMIWPFDAAEYSESKSRT